MIERLLYLGLPQFEESPRSVLLRTITKNGYRHVHQLARFFGLQNIGPLSIQLGESELVNELMVEADWLKDRFKKMFYRQKKGITNTEPVEIMGTRVPVDALMATKHKICLECLLDGYMRQIQDIEWVDVCPYHGCRYLNACPSCGKTFNWTWMRFDICSCGFELNYKSSKVIKDDPSGSSILLGYLRKQNSDGVIRIQQVLGAMRFDEQKNVDERIRLFNHAAMIATNPKHGIKIWLNEMKEKHAGMPDRVLLSRLLVLKDQKIWSAAEETLMVCSAELPSRCVDCKCQEESLSATEIEAVLGVSNATLLQLARAGKIYRRAVGNRGVEYPYKSVCNLYQSLKVKSSHDTKLKKAKLCETNSFSLGLNKNLDLLSEGSLVLVEADARRPLSEFMVVNANHNNNDTNNKFPEAHMTVSEAAKRLHVYPDAIRRALKAGYISKSIIIVRSNAVLIPVKDVERFEQEYVFIGALSKQYGAKTTAYSAQLATAGIHPVSGPGIDNALVAMYKRSDFQDHDLKKIAALDKFTTNAGRKKGDPKIYDANDWMRSSEVGKLLGVNVQKLDVLEDYGLLKKGTPPGREAENTRFYRSQSVLKTKQWLETALSVIQLAKEEGTNVRLFTIRFVDSGYVKPLRINGDVLISSMDAERVRTHYKEYCTCSEAAKHIGAPQRHFHNMIKLGRISPATVEESEVDTITLLRWKDVQKKGDLKRQEQENAQGRIWRAVH